MEGAENIETSNMKEVGNLLVEAPENQKLIIRQRRRAEYLAESLGGATKQIMETAGFMLQTADTMTPGSFGRAREVENVSRLYEQGREMLRLALDMMKYSTSPEPEEYTIQEKYKKGKKGR